MPLVDPAVRLFDERGNLSDHGFELDVDVLSRIHAGHEQCDAFLGMFRLLRQLFRICTQTRLDRLGTP